MLGDCCLLLLLSCVQHVEGLLLLLSCVQHVGGLLSVVLQLVCAHVRWWYVVCTMYRAMCVVYICTLLKDSKTTRWCQSCTHVDTHWLN